MKATGQLLAGIILVLIGLASLALAQERPAKSDEELRALAHLEQRDWDDLDGSGQGRLGDEFDGKLRTLNRDERFRLAEFLLQPKEEEYPSFEALKEIFRGQAPTLEFTLEQKGRIRQELVRFVAKRKEEARGWLKGPALYPYLRAITGEIIRPLEEYLVSPDVEEEQGSSAGTTVKADPFWSPRSLKQDDPPYIAGYAWSSFSPVVLNDEAGIQVIEVSSGILQNLPRKEIIKLSEKARFPGKWFLAETLVDDGQVLAADQGTLASLECPIPSPDHYIERCLSGDRLYWLWDPPPHYFGEVERDPKLLEDKEYAARLQIRFGYVELILPGMPQQEAKNLPFQNPKDGAASSHSRLVGALPSGRIVVTQNAGYPRANTDTQLWIGNSAANEAFTLRMSTDGSAEVSVISGSPDRLMLSYPPPGDEEYDDFKSIPKRLVFYDVESKTFTLGFKREDETLSPTNWPLEPFGDPKWELPESLVLPPVDEVENCQVLPHGDDIYLFLTRHRPGQDAVPRFELYHFAKDNPQPRMIRLELPLSDDMEKHLAMMAEKKQNPSRLTQIDPKLLRCDEHWVLASWLGLWRVTAKEVELAFAKAEAEAVARPE